MNVIKVDAEFLQFSYASFRMALPSLTIASLVIRELVSSIADEFLGGPWWQPPGLNHSGSGLTYLADAQLWVLTEQCLPLASEKQERHCAKNEVAYQTGITASLEMIQPDVLFVILKASLNAPA